MVLEKLGDSLRNSLSKIAKAVFVDEKLVNELVKDIQRALLQADVNVKLVFDLSKTIKERILKEDTPPGLTKREYLVNIVYEELVKFLGGEPEKIDIDSVEKKPYKIMLLGLFGSGKTTTTGKLGKFFKKRGYKVAFLGLDVHRPGAMDQLSQIAAKIQVPALIDKEEKDAVKIYQRFEDELSKFDVVIVDTAGRDALSDDLIKEIETLTNLIEPEQKFLVISADIGQTAEKQAQQFHDSCGVTGVIATKMDGTAKAGGALSACAITDANIKFIGVGENIDDLEEFKPKGFVSRLLGMGDLELLLEKAKDAMTEEDAKDMGKKFLKGDFNLIDLYEQMKAMKKMGPLSKVMEMIPGFGQLKLPKNVLEGQQEKLEHWKYAMNSMTKKELEEPDKIDVNRIERISKGSGRSISEIRELLKQYKQSKKMVKMFKGAQNPKHMEKMMAKMQKGMGGIKF
ncbi:MAG: signal recognition particle protein Srp54 [Minisyncoccales bacterium]